MTGEGGDAHARRAWWIAALGSALLGGGLAALVAASGGTGRAGLAWLLLGGAVSCAVGALYAVVTAVLDRLRDRPVGRARAVAAAALFVLGAVLPAMVVGLAPAP